MNTGVYICGDNAWVYTGRVTKFICSKWNIANTTSPAKRKFHTPPKRFHGIEYYTNSARPNI